MAWWGFTTRLHSASARRAAALCAEAAAARPAVCPPTRVWKSAERINARTALVQRTRFMAAARYPLGTRRAPGLLADTLLGIPDAGNSRPPGGQASPTPLLC